MFLSLTAIDSQVQFHDFFCEVSTLEQAFDLLSYTASMGDRLLSAHLVDEGHCTHLSVEAFDDVPVLIPIQALEKQWKRVLKKPLNHRSIHNQWVIDLKKGQLERGQHRITQLRGCIEILEQRRQSIQTYSHRKSYRSELINQLETSLAQYQRRLAVAQVQQQSNVDKLVQLQKQ